MSTGAFFKHLNRLSRGVQNHLVNCYSQVRQSRHLSIPSGWHGLWEPNDLKLEPDIPEYESISIQMEGYDYPVLESYSKFVHNVVDKVLVNNDAWPMPANSVQVRMFHPRSTAISEKHDLQKFKRIVVSDGVPSSSVPVITQILRRHVPEGVNVCLKEPNEEEDSQRYVPDYNVLELKAQRDLIESGKLSKKKKKF